MRRCGPGIARVAALVLALAPPSVAAWPWSGPPQSTVDALARGVNLSGWLQHGTEDPRLAPGSADWRRLRALGLTHVRIPFDPAALVGERGLPDPVALARLRAAAEGAVAHELAVVLALQLPSPIKRRLATSAPDRAALQGLWQAIALALADLPTERLLFEPLNENELQDPVAARALQGELLQALRAVLPRHTLVAAGGRWSAAADLARLEPYRDRNLVYTFHFYEPHAFTHQGADWGDPQWRGLAGLPYPSSPEAVAAVLPGISAELRALARWHGQQAWDARRLAAELEPAAQWSRRHGRPVWCGEFGVRRGAVDERHRAAWLRDVREALEARGLGWALWDYRGGFGLFDESGGEPRPDPATLQALGLRAP